MLSYVQEALEDILNKQRETKFLLWQSFLTFNGFLITVLIAIVSLGSINSAPLILKLLVIVLLIALFISCGLIIYSFKQVEIGYKKMGEQLRKYNSNDPPSKLEELAGTGNKINTFEKINIYMELIVAILVCILVSYFLLYYNTTNTKPIRKSLNFNKLKTS